MIAIILFGFVVCIQLNSGLSASNGFIDDKLFTHTFLKSIGNPEKRESVHLCLGGEDTDSFDGLSRHCAFKNICYNHSEDRFIYFSGLSTNKLPVMSHEGSDLCKEDCEKDPHLIYDFPKDFVVIASMVVQATFQIKIVPGTIPKELNGEQVYFHGSEESIPPVHVIHSGIGSTSNAIGHIIAEYTYPTYHLLDLFELTKPMYPNLEFLLTESPCPHDKKCDYVHLMLKALSPRQYKNVEDVKKSYPPSRPKAPYNPELTCYNRLIVGAGNFYGSSRLVSPSKWGSFMSNFMKSVGIEKSEITKQRIIFINKGGAHSNRVALNAKEIVDRIRETFKVDVDLWEWNGETFVDELRMTQKYTMCISVCGGTAFSCTFLPDGASNIYLSVWYSSAYSGRPGRNNNMEHVTWTWDQRHRSYAYPVLLNETIPNRDRKSLAPSNDYLMQWKHNKGFKVDFDRLADLVNDGLRNAEVNFGLRDSFVRLNKSPIGNLL